MTEILDHYREVFSRHSKDAALIDATCSDTPAREVSYQELEGMAASLAGVFFREGLGAGDRLAVILSNGIGFAATYLACFQAGITIIPVNPHLSPEDVAYIVSLSGPKMVMAEKTFAHLLPRQVENPWIVENVEELIGPDSGDAAAFAGRPENILSIHFTSGTTNRPKGVCHRVSALFGNALAFNAHLGLTAGARLMHVMPMSYMAGFLNTLLAPLLAGAGVILAPQFDARTALTFWQPAMAHGVTAMWLTPTMLAALVRLDRDPETRSWTRDHLDYICVGTAPLSSSVKEDFEQRFCVRLLESYGMTEILIASGFSPEAPEKPGSVGAILPGVDIQSRDPDGTVLKAGEEGDLWIRSPHALEGYLDGNCDGSALSSPLQEGWLPTGDIGCKDQSGHLYITGRRKDLIIHGGANVSPPAVEESILRHEDVEDVAVVGVPHPFWGEEVVAFVKLTDGGALTRETQASLRAHCESHLSSDSRPGRFLAVESIPRTVTGKIQKNQLLEEHLPPGESMLAQ
ncbi:MAG: acyl--CoA ligase [Alphaproteobacteria bacterium]|nr:acyl--CoA ligase [Alphaproteobacteria bacterium]